MIGAGSPGLPPCRTRFTPARQSDGDWPVQRRNARVKELPAENPSK